MAVKKEEKKKSSVFTGKRKKAIARANFRKGRGIIKINNQPLDLFPNEMYKLMMKEPLLIAGEGWKKFDIKITTNGGGPMGQASAARQAIAKGLASMLGEGIKQAFMDYDRNLLVYDPRRTEPHKPPHSSWGARRYKQRSKR